MAKRAAEGGDISDRPLKQARTAEQLRQAIGEYIIAIPAEVLALVGLSVVDLANVADVSQDWRRAVFTLLLSTEHGKEMRSKMGLSEKDIVEAIDNDTFVYELRTLARFHRDFTNPLSGKPVAMVDTVLHYLRDGLITGTDRYEQAYDLILRLTRIATMLAVKQLFRNLTLRGQRSAKLELLFSGIKDHADGRVYPLDRPRSMPSTHPVFYCLGLNAHAIRVAADRATPPPIELQFQFESRGPVSIQSIAFDVFQPLFGVDADNVLTLMSIENEFDTDFERTHDRPIQNGTNIPLARLRLHDMRQVNGTEYTFGLSVIHIDVDAILLTTRGFGEQFEAYDGLADTRRFHRERSAPLTAMRRQMIQMPERLVAAYDFMALGLDYIDHQRPVDLIGQADTPASPAFAQTSVVSYLASANETANIGDYLRSEDIDMLFDAYQMWRYTVMQAVPVTARRRWLPNEFPAPRRRSDGTLHRTFWRSPLIQCATCPAEVVTHVSINGKSRQGRCATCVTMQ